jgi:hypothetical protein
MGQVESGVYHRPLEGSDGASSVVIKFERQWLSCAPCCSLVA